MEAELDDFLPDHAVDVGLRGELVGDVIKDEELLLVLCLDYQLVLPFGEGDAAGEARLGVVGPQSDHHLHLLLSIQPAAARRLHPY